MAYQEILYEVTDRICTITLNRPAQLNAYTQRMCYELQCAFDAADADDDVRAIIVTGSGRAFCAGADLQAGGDLWSKNPAGSADRAREEDLRKYKFTGDSGGRISRRIYECNKPVIAAINGPAVGVGLTMTLPMDIRIAATNTKMGFVFAARGILPEACSTWFLPRLVGVSRAAEWFYSARVFRSEEALQAGLLRSLHEAGDVVTEARKLAREFVDNSSAVSIAMTRHLIWRMLGADHPIEAHGLDTAGILALGRSKDAYEGTQAFLEKRKANFTDRVSHDMPSFFPWWQERELPIPKR
jgi:enoyl-CoA hydratase/carnithine racemase